MSLLPSTWLIAALALGQAPAGDLDRLQGTWTTQAGPQKDIPVVLEIDGCCAHVNIQTPQGLKIQVQGESRLDEAAHPKSIDWIKFAASDGQEFPEVQAIYEIDGETLKLRTGGLADGRPTEFTPGEGVLSDVLIFQHQKVKTASAAPTTSGPLRDRSGG